MVTLITGGSGSGKSAFAENLMIQRTTHNRFYLATMIPFDAECKKRIQRHRTMREDKQFITLEVPMHIKNLTLPIYANCKGNSFIETTYPPNKTQTSEIQPKVCNQKEKMNSEKTTTCNVLLECMSNLVANELYEQDGAHDKAIEDIIEGIQQLKKTCNELIIVTNEVFSDGKLYDDEMHYLQVLGGINTILANMADEVIEVVYGIPVYHKRNAI